ncbi:MAG: diguanylate cyclase [Burkholderiales bacterium]
MAEKKPFEIAREALMKLTARKLMPTPVNYQAVYNEIAGTPDVAPFPDEALRKIARALPAKSAAQSKQKALLDRAIGQSNWQSVQEVLVAYGNAAANPVERTAASMADSNRSVSTTEILEPVARLIENTLPALGDDDPRFSEQVGQLLKVLREPSAEMSRVKAMLGNFSHRLSFAAEDQGEIRATLLKLLHLIIENIGELSLDDSWLKRQIDALMAAATPPLTLRRLDDLERRLKDVMFKQIEAKGRTLEAQEEMRRMLATFIERLALMTDSTSTYHSKIEESARLMERAKSIEEIGPVLKDVISATRGIAFDMAKVRDELRGMREKASASETEIAQLHHELNAASAQARHDPLTGALNRKGLDEAMARELADVKRKETPLCMSLLDIDNFKKLNDSKGHDTGDAALNHLVSVTRESMRTQDTLARYGGEEFVILMPDTTLDKGIDAMTRLQRALTRRFFLAGTEQILITFSAGVAQLAAGESGEEAISRADQAMYLAKRAGKNRVLGA